MRINVDTSPSDGADFDFDINGPGACNFTDTFDDGDSEDFSCSDDGSWSIEVDPPVGWVLESVVCSVEEDGDTPGDDSSGVSYGAYGADIEIVDNEHVDCDFDFDLDGPASGIASVVVTANPNVIECGGTSIITATARDANGHVISGVGFHFATDTGHLVVSPNNAHTEEGRALLTLQPGMTTSTVYATVGAETSDIETEGVTVQQFCLGVTTDSTTAPGSIGINASNRDLVCGETVFLGANIRDNKGQVLPDGTTVNFLATSGTLSPASANSINGALNITYTAANINGAVRITAAAGASYGFLELNVKCNVASPVSSGGGGGPAPCVSIGDGVCITPPNTGRNAITPPSTGDGGIR